MRIGASALAAILGLAIAAFILAAMPPVARALSRRLAKGDRVLVKGSRAARMERVIELLAEGAH